MIEQEIKADIVTANPDEQYAITSKPPQLSGVITVSVKAGQFRLVPQRSMTGYQAVRIAAMLAIVGSNSRQWFAIDDLFSSVYAETQEHWEKVG